MFKTILIANRGVIACRILRTLRRMGIRSAAVYSDADRHSLHVEQADTAVHIGASPANQSYLVIDKIIEAARRTGAEAIHPGYGFLSENPLFAEACEAAGIEFIGPTADQMRAFGLKHSARQLARAANVPLLPGTGLLASLDAAVEAAAQIGFPLMLKSTAGGGGIGMRLCSSEQDLASAFEAVARISSASFGDSGLYLERFVERARHIEVQIFGDGKGGAISLGERDCSVQRRNQKVIEETPAPGLPSGARSQLFEAAVALCRSVNYRSAGTVEFVLDAGSGNAYFLEVNTRLQVEHGVTEEVTGVDLVEWMVRLAAGELPPLAELQPKQAGHSIQVRLYAEDPGQAHRPVAGLMTHAEFPENIRVESAIVSGSEVTPFYDPMIAKVIVRGPTRDHAVHEMQKALAATQLYGVETNLRYLRQITASYCFQEGGVTTAYLNSVPYNRSAIEVLEPGTQSTLQDFPGRLGYWAVGVPPSGPMDPLAFRLANRILGNQPEAAAIEMTLSGPELKFTSDTVIAITGADMGGSIDGAFVPMWSALPVKAGSVLRFGNAINGARSYLAVQGGFEAPKYLNSRSTFILGKFGGITGRPLRAGDVLHFDVLVSDAAPATACPIAPQYSGSWEIGVVYGPHGSPDFFTPEDIRTFFAAEWKVHFNSDRTGVRLMGPKPQWARKDGGEAGLHPSNLHDNAYAIGSVDFTGDMPVLLGPDGPSLGGFVCPAVIANAELWKMGQLRPGDSVRFRPISVDDAVAMDAQMDRCIESLCEPFPELPPAAELKTPIVSESETVVCRADGDRYLLIECGANTLDFRLRFRIHALERTLKSLALPGIIDMTPGIRSLQVHYDSRLLSRDALLDAVTQASETAAHSDDLEVPSRTVHLPLSWDDPATQLAIQKYTQGVRPDAPWCPSNIEFIRRINGLESIDDVYRTVFGASYMVLGLGDVYLGAPVATPVDPRHRLVTTKYNPARTWTPENAVGIGGAYLCVYGMEGPGGYQFVGRTVQMWNTYRETREFRAGQPWLLDFFDQLRFYPVTAAELLEMRDAFPHGGLQLKIEHGAFSLPQYQAEMKSIEAETLVFRKRQQEAFINERERWAAAGQSEFIEAPAIAAGAGDADQQAPEGCHLVRSPITASVWKVAVESGQQVEAGQPLVILEAMKMEVLVSAPYSGTVQDLRCLPSAVVMAGQQLVVLRTEAAAV